MAVAASRLKITEIFRSLQGEADTVGIPTVFVRLTGCPLRCGYCDTAYAFHGGQWSSLDDIVARVRDLEVTHVCVTGGEEARNRYEELGGLAATDLVKFVIVDRADYEWSRAQLRDRGLAERCTVLFSPSHADLPARDLADWVLEDRLPVRFQVQLHKYLWGDQPGR